MSRTAARSRRHKRVRRKVSGTGERPRLAVFRSNRQLYAQIIDDGGGRTIAAASSLDPELRGSPHDVERAAKLGKLIAARAIEKGIKQVVFDRGGYRYHGRVKALAEAARESGLTF